MRLIAGGTLGLTAALLLAVPSATQANIGQGDPTSDFARGANCQAASPLRAPVTVVFERFETEAAAREAIDAAVPWPDPTVPQDQWLEMLTGTSPGATSCRANEADARIQPPSNSRRTFMRLWSTGFVTAATPVRQREKTGTDPATCAPWVTAPNAYAIGRTSFEIAFQGQSWPDGPYPIEEVYWGNTTSLQTCYGATVASDGFVAIIHPKDDFGFNEDLQAPLANPNAGNRIRESPPAGSTIREVGNCDEAPVQGVYEPRRLTAYGEIKESVEQQWENLGVTTLRFGLHWKSVAPCSTPGPVDQWAWQLWEPVFADLVDPNDSHPDIRPIVVVFAPPPREAPGDPDWADPVCPNLPYSAPDQPPSAIVNTTPNSGGLGTWRIFVREVAERYGDRAKAIEVWNEPNDPDYWGGCDTRQQDDYETYLDILNFAGKGVVDSGKNVPLVTAGLTPADPPQDPPPPAPGQVLWDEYLRDVLDHRSQLDPATQAALDYVGLHPYRTERERNASYGAYDESALTQLNLAETIVANRNLNMPVWVTEAGTTHVQNFAPPHVQPPTYVAGGPSSQGFWDLAIYDLLRNRGAPLTLIHRFADRPLDPDRGQYWSEYGYGIVDSALEPKYGYCVLAQERTQVYPDPQPPGC